MSLRATLCAFRCLLCLDEGWGGHHLIAEVTKLAVAVF